MHGSIALYLPSLRGGGAEKVMVTLANAFATRGLSVDLVLASATGEYMQDVSTNVRLVDLRAKRVLTSLPALVRYLRKERPSVVLSAMSHANVLALWARALSGVPTRVVVSERSNLTQTLLHTKGLSVRVVARVMGPSYARADGVIAVSRGVADDLAHVIGFPRKRIRIVHNPLDLTLIRQKAAMALDHPWFAPGEPPVILGVGSLTPPKDFSTLLRAFSALRRKRSARLVILGEGALRPELEDLAVHLGIDADVALPGFKDNPFSWMRRARLFVLSSAWEGLPNVLIQAMACGTRVVSTNCQSGPAEILEDGTWGRLVPVRDTEALANAMAATLDESDPPAVAHRAADFSLETIVEEYLRAIFPGGIDSECKHL